jgi:phosphoribosylglycinamide formyltransferase-1
MKKLLIFASGSKNGGGSGFEALVRNSVKGTGILDAEIVGVVSNYEDGGVKQRAEKLKVPFEYFPLPREAQDYQRIIQKYNPDLAALSGWLKLIKGVDPTKTINIHPGPLPRFGGQGMYGHFVHEAVIRAYSAGKIKHSAVTMHFVTDKYDKGPIFFQIPVWIEEGDNADTLGKRVNQFEHAWQPFITNLVVSGQISWDGKNPKSLKVPDGYNLHKPR